MMKVDIQALIPQREPIIMVDRLDKVEHAYAETSLEIRPDNFLLLRTDDWKRRESLSILLSRLWHLPVIGLCRPELPNLR